MKNYEILERFLKDYLGKLAQYDSTSDLIGTFSESLNRLYNLVNDNDLRGKIDDIHFNSFILDVISNAREANNTSNVLYERFSYKTISIHTKHLLMSIENKHLKLAAIKIKDILVFTALSKIELSKATKLIKKLFKNSKKHLKLKSNLNHNIIIYGMIILVLTGLYIIKYQFKILKTFVFFALVSGIVFYVYHYQVNINNTKTYNVNEIFNLLELSKNMINKIDLIHSEYCCELSRLNLFILSIIPLVNSQQNKVSEIISQISKEASENTELGKSRAKYLLDAKLNNLDLKTPTDLLQPELREAVNNLKAFTSHVIYETTMYFTKVKSISDATIKYVDELKFIVKEKRMFNFKKFLDYLVNVLQNSIKDAQPLIVYLGNQINSIDNIIAMTEKAKRDNLNKEELSIMYKKLSIAGVSVLLGGGSPLSIGVALVGYIGSEYIFNHENLNKFKEIKEKFDKFFNHIRNLQNFLSNDQQKINLTKNKLDTVLENSKSLRRDVSEIINDENEETVMTSYALGEDFEVQIVLDGLDLIRTKNEELFALTSDIINDQFKLS